jgi:hypothetical protein
MVTRVQPTAVQRGQTTEIVISGAQNFAGASAILFEGQGLTAEVIGVDTPAKTPDRPRRGSPRASVRAKLSAGAAAGLGPRELRVVTPQGVSSIGVIVVVDNPVVAEVDDKANDDPLKAQTLALPTVVAGAIGKVEDVDWYGFHAEAGQRFAFSLWGNRLENKIHDLQTHLDPILLVCDAQGRELAADDNSQLADPLLLFTAREAGDYRLQVRDTNYQGDANWTYVLHASAGPFATSVAPLAVTPGQSAEIRAWGIGVEPAEPIRFDVPADVPFGLVSLPLTTPRGTCPPVAFVATRLPRELEHGDAAGEAVRGQSFAVPAALSGDLSKFNDLDCYMFAARKGQAYTFEVVARRLGSAADPVLRIMDVRGKSLAEADDTFGKDPRLDWTASADGLFALEVQDLHGRGGTGFGYALLAREAEPDFTVFCDPDKINVGPGARTAVFARVERRTGFNGPVTLTWKGLPAGLTASPLTIPAHMTQGVMVLASTVDAHQGAALATLFGEGKTGNGTILRTAVPRQEIYLPGGGRGLYPVATLAAAVTDPSDITIDASPAELTLRPGESKAIDVTVHRREGFAQPVNLALDLSHLGQVFASALPPGVVFKEAGSKTLLDANTTSGKIVLEAQPNAPPSEHVPIAVMGHVSINFVVKTAYSSAPLLVTVTAKQPTAR